MSSDIIAVVIPESVDRSVSTWIPQEIAYSTALNKQILLFSEKSSERGIGVEPFDLSSFYQAIRLPIIRYESNIQLANLLSSSVLESEQRLKSSLYSEKRKEQKTLIEVLSESLKKNVLVLGKDSDGEGSGRMECISRVLSSRGYVPVLLKKLPEIRHLSLEEKMIRVGALCRFVIAEDSRASGHIDEVRLCAECQYITATIREAGSASSWMQAHYPHTFNFINRFCYRSPNQLATKDPLCENMSASIEMATKQAIIWAEERIIGQKKYFDNHIYGNF